MRGNSFLKKIKPLISDIVDEAIRNKGRSSYKYNQKDITEVPAYLSEYVRTASNGSIDISNKNIAVNYGDLYHEYISHRDETVEFADNQLPLTPESIKEAIEAIYYPDMVEAYYTDKHNHTQRQSFLYVKKSNGYYIVAEAVGGNRNKNITPAMILNFNNKKWQDYLKSGLSLAEFLNRKRPDKLIGIDGEQKKPSYCGGVR